jgi:hypothetical protein
VAVGGDQYVKRINSFQAAISFVVIRMRLGGGGDKWMVF